MAISLLLNWYEQLVVHGFREKIDYESLEQVYREKQEVNVMLETALNKHGQRFFIQGKAEGKIEERFNTLVLLLESKFGDLNSNQKARLKNLSDEQLVSLSKKLWTIQSLEELFDGLGD